MSLRYVNLTRFEASVFKNILQEMIQSTGTLEIPGGNVVGKCIYTEFINYIFLWKIFSEI